jgi:hypothetical protein
MVKLLIIMNDKMCEDALLDQSKSIRQCIRTLKNATAIANVGSNLHREPLEFESRSLSEES